MIEGTEVCKLGLAENDCAAWKTQNLRWQMRGATIPILGSAVSSSITVSAFVQMCEWIKCDMYQGHNWTPTLPQANRHALMDQILSST
ncbi:hypothetical protein PILCRDRAFT_827815 [Piloderma croceum F 1598]|uniref:Uncharacterized protein n=1 Tax=Piloderma croceum (strain F 1598) TaxID=765440 RepID=A0A0C3BC33_PILCF|nr:hypothetical protein PILCRDRAFT_827815 [Piloderma croceum F 1598]